MSAYSIAHFIEQHYSEYYKWESYPADECVRIHKIAEEWGVFSNFAHTDLVVDGVRFNSAERLFQCLKFKDAEALKAVYNAPNPKFAAKKYEKACRREDWGEIIVDAMKYCLMVKYEQSEEFRTKLERSKDKYIVEDQSSFPKKTPDTWGVKSDGKGNFEGPNLLGRLLMELRDNGRFEYKRSLDSIVEPIVTLKR